MGRRVVLLLAATALAVTAALVVLARRAVDDASRTEPAPSLRFPALEATIPEDAPPPGDSDDRIRDVEVVGTSDGIARGVWCGTGLVETDRLLEPPEAAAPDLIHVTIDRDTEWNALLAQLKGTNRADDRRVAMLRFLEKRSTTAPRADVVALLHDLAATESDPVLRARLQTAADDLERR